MTQDTTQDISDKLTDTGSDLQQRWRHGADRPGQAVGSRDAVGGVLPQGPQQWLVEVNHVTLRLDGMSVKSSQARTAQERREE